MYRLIIPAMMALAMSGAILWSYKMGSDNGQRKIISEIEKARAESVERKKEIDDELRDLPADALLERALGAVRQ